jgi:hypothetical protein
LVETQEEDSTVNRDSPVSPEWGKVRVLDQARHQRAGEKEMKASYTKLKSGAWGVRVEGMVSDGQSITVRKKDGSEKSETIEKVLWAGQGVSLCAIKQVSNAGHSGHSGHRPGTCVNCGGPCNPRYRRCLDCVDGGSTAHGGASYYDRNGNFVLGDDD